MAVKFRDYYEVLGVPRTASADDIPRLPSLARRSSDLHPAADRAKATEAFKELNEARGSERPAKRAKYDALGAN